MLLISKAKNNTQKIGLPRPSCSLAHQVSGKRRYDDRMTIPFRSIAAVAVAAMLAAPVVQARKSKSIID